MLVLSPQAVKSLWVKRELLYALQEKRFENRIVPVLYKDCRYKRLSWTLDALQIIPFTAGFDDGCAQLLRVKGLHAKPVSRKRRQRP
jgi:hypothetical protein